MSHRLLYPSSRHTHHTVLCFSVARQKHAPLFISFHLSHSRSFLFLSLGRRLLALVQTTQIPPFTNGFLCARPPLPRPPPAHSRPPFPPLPALHPFDSQPARVWMELSHRSSHSMMCFQPSASLRNSRLNMCYLYL